MSSLWKILHGDCLAEMEWMANESVDSIVTDPPYGLNFMNKHWDYEVPSIDVWRECLRVLRPGGHLLSFFGTRTYHRGVIPIEDAGFKMRPGARRLDAGSAARFFYCAKANKKDREADNLHPTVKPTDLMRYLCRLVTPAGGLVFDPFMGSGSTGKAALLEGFRFIGIEREAEYINIAKARLVCAEQEGEL